MSDLPNLSAMTTLALLRLHRKEIREYLASKRGDEIFDNNYPVWVELMARLQGRIDAPTLFRLVIGRAYVWGYCGTKTGGDVIFFNEVFDVVDAQIQLTEK